MLALLAKRFAPLPSLCSIARRTAIKAATLRQDLRIVTLELATMGRYGNWVMGRKTPCYKAFCEFW
ncbi:MAG: hypothetical protein M3N42_14285 [Cyanobacteriota bacterium]|nr:hypothetical protein [Cyanobacteriota bacterium]